MAKKLFMAKAPAAAPQPPQRVGHRPATLPAAPFPAPGSSASALGVSAEAIEARLNAARAASAAASVAVQDRAREAVDAKEAVDAASAAAAAAVVAVAEAVNAASAEAATLRRARSEAEAVVPVLQPEATAALAAAAKPREFAAKLLSEIASLRRQEKKARDQEDLFRGINIEKEIAEKEPAATDADAVAKVLEVEAAGVAASLAVAENVAAAAVQKLSDSEAAHAQIVEERRRAQKAAALAVEAGKEALHEAQLTAAEAVVFAQQAAAAVAVFEAELVDHYQVQAASAAAKAKTLSSNRSAVSDARRRLLDHKQKREARKRHEEAWDSMPGPPQHVNIKAPVPTSRPTARAAVSFAANTSLRLQTGSRSVGGTPSASFRRHSTFGITNCYLHQG